MVARQGEVTYNLKSFQFENDLQNHYRWMHLFAFVVHAGQKDIMTVLNLGM
jgi:hypothetical protein